MRASGWRSFATWICEIEKASGYLRFGRFAQDKVEKERDIRAKTCGHMQGCQDCSGLRFGHYCHTRDPKKPSSGAQR